jgi:uncharacterized membrane protein YgcG
MKTKTESIVAVICLIVLIGLAFAARGQRAAVTPPGSPRPIATAQRGPSAYPQPQDNYVNDYAGLLTVRHAGKIRKSFAKLEERRGVEAVVVTINSIRDYPTGDSTIESFATNLFNTWGIGHKEKNDGVLILVAVKDRECRIELGAGYGTAYDSAMKSVIDRKMIPCFKKGDYSTEIYKAAFAAIGKLTGKIPWGTILIGLVVLVVIIVLVRHLVRGQHPEGATAGAGVREAVEPREVRGQRPEEVPTSAGAQEVVEAREVPEGATPGGGVIAREELRPESSEMEELSEELRRTRRELQRERRLAALRSRPAQSDSGGAGFFDILGGLLDIFGSLGGGGGGGFGGGSSFGGGASGRW